VAYISIGNIDRILLNVTQLERTFDTEGPLAIHPTVAAMYVSKDYATAPCSAQEARALGQRADEFNGLKCSFYRITSTQKDGRTIVTADIAPTRYLFSKAMRDVVKEGDYSLADMHAMTPNMAHVSLVVPVRFNGQYHLLSQIKGKALGEGQIHAGLAAGHVEAHHLNQCNPLVAALQDEVSEEIGLDLSRLDHTSFVYVVDEAELGTVNFASVAQLVDVDKVLAAYETSIRGKLPGKLEVNGLAVLPIAGLTFVPLERPLDEVVCYKPTLDGLVASKEAKDWKKDLRPYTQATLEYVREPANLRSLLQKAGF
jgi:hypothetical protein